MCGGCSVINCQFLEYVLTILRTDQPVRQAGNYPLTPEIVTNQSQISEYRDHKNVTIEGSNGR